MRHPYSSPGRHPDTGADAAIPDIIVVGGGAAGSVIARRLAEDPALRVTLIEAGPADTDPALLDASAWAGLLGGAYDWGEQYDPTPLTGGRPVAIPRGRVLGGSSSINAMLWYRGHPSDYDEWDAAGATGWNYETLLPFFRRSEDWQGGSTEFRGAGGPMRIETSANPHPIATALLESAAELGLPVIDDANVGVASDASADRSPNEGATLANLNATTAPDGHVTRWSTVRGYLAPAAAWPNLTILTDSPVVGLEFEGTRCVGVTFVDGSGSAAGNVAPDASSGHASIGHADSTARRPVTLRARHGVVVAAGGLHTPRLLLQSGIGAADELAPLGIRSLVDLPGVGRNLQDHPLLMGMNFRASAPLGPVRDNGGGSMLNWRSSHARGKPDLHAFVVQGPHATGEVRSDYGLPGFGAEVRPDDHRIFAVSPGLMHSRSIGWVRLRPGSGPSGLEIQPNYLSEPGELDALLESIDTVHELAATSGYRALGATPLAPGRTLSRSEKIAFVRRSVSTFFHSCGTAAMGTGPDSVVSPELAVHGIDGLWVADASVIPVIPTSNTQVPVIALAERAADLLRAHLGSSAIPTRSGARSFHNTETRS